MEPLYVEPIDLDEKDPDPLQLGGNLNDLSMRAFAEMDNLRDSIVEWKALLYSQLVHKDDDAGSNGAMITFQSLWMHALAQWIGLLDEQRVPPPQNLPAKTRAPFEAITKFMESMHGAESDVRTLVYNVLFQLSIQHPFNFLTNPTAAEEDS